MNTLYRNLTLTIIEPALSYPKLFMDVQTHMLKSVISADRF